MEHLEVFDCSNILIACYFNDDRGCAHENREHTLIYLCSGELEIEERGKKTVLHPGECAFMRRDNRMWLHKKVENGKPYRSIVLKFSRPFLRDFYRLLDNRLIPGDAKPRQDKPSRPPLRPPGHPFTVRIGHSLFRSRRETLRRHAETENDRGGIRIAPHRPEPLCVPVRLRGTVKIDILDYLNENYMLDLSMNEIASYTGRSLATFKRDFAKVSDLTPQKWIIKRRLEAPAT